MTFNDDSDAEVYENRGRPLTVDVLLAALLRDPPVADLKVGVELCDGTGSCRPLRVMHVSFSGPPVAYEKLVITVGDPTDR